MRAPFTQLFSVNAFIRSGDVVKQVPLVYVIMSSKAAGDYKAVFKVLCEKLPTEPWMSTITADLEASVWKAAIHVFPDVTIHGCVFHFTQAVWR